MEDGEGGEQPNDKEWFGRLWADYLLRRLAVITVNAASLWPRPLYATAGLSRSPTINYRIQIGFLVISYDIVVIIIQIIIQFLSQCRRASYVMADIASARRLVGSGYVETYLYVETRLLCSTASGAGSWELGAAASPAWLRPCPHMSIPA